MAAQATVSEGVMSRMKSFKKSVRDSFRRRRRRAAGESPRKAQTSPLPQEGAASPEKKEASQTDEPKPEEVATSSAEGTKQESGSQGSVSPKKQSPKRSPDGGEEEVRPVERSVEARGESPATTTEQLTSLVRCVYFGKTYIVNATTLSKTFWVGTNGGKVQIHTVTVPEEPDRRATDQVQCVLAKEIQLQHRAPVLSMAVVDGRDFPLGGHPTLGAAKDATPNPAQDGGHRVVLCSEEQLKTFHLPGLKPGRHKFKLTATEGMRVRKVEHVTLQSKNDENRWESFVVLMTNEGEVQAFSNHQFRRYLKAPCIRTADISGILSTVLSPNGEGFYLRSSSEWQRFTVGAAFAVRPQCSLELPEGARPPPPAEPSPPPVQVEEGDKKDEEGPPQAQSTPEEKEKEGEGGKAGDVSVLSGESANVSAIPTDVTVDSIRDYTTEQHTTEECRTSETVTSGGAVTITEKTTKTTIISSGGVDTESDVVVSREETKEVKDLVNGEAGQEV